MTWGFRNLLSYIQFLQNEIHIDLTQTEGMRTPQTQQGGRMVVMPCAAGGLKEWPGN